MYEVWKPISEFDYYQISSYGRVKRLKHKIRNSIYGFRVVNELILKPYVDFDGYEIVSLVKTSGKPPKGFRVHRLVTSAFLDNPMKLSEVNHKDGNKRNNRVDNLEWVTHLDNVRHANNLGLRPNTGIAIRCCETKEEFISIMEAARYYDVSADVISMILNNQTKKSKLLPNTHFERI